MKKLKQVNLHLENSSIRSFLHSVYKKGLDLTPGTIGLLNIASKSEVDI